MCKCLPVFVMVMDFFHGQSGWSLNAPHFTCLFRFKNGSQPGLPPVTFTSTSFVAGVLLANAAFAMAGTKRRLGNQHMWKHSATNFANLQWVKLQLSSLETDDSFEESSTFMGDYSSRSWESRRHSVQLRSIVDLTSLPALTEAVMDDDEFDC